MIRCPRLIIAGLGGDTGKTAISVGLCRFWNKKGYGIIPFKKGPDYIDMGWLGIGANHPCYNLDLFMMNREQVLASFCLNTLSADMAVIEGNRGLYDGMDAQGNVSTAELAKLLQTPVIIIVDCTKVTRTVAALVLGLQTFDRDVPIKGVILNRLAGNRHEQIIRESIKQYCKIPVVGAVPKLGNVTFPGRHLGLVPYQEHPMSEEAVEKSAEVVSQYLDTDQLGTYRRGCSADRLSLPRISRSCGKNSDYRYHSRFRFPVLLSGKYRCIKKSRGGNSDIQRINRRSAAFFRRPVYRRRFP